jgi:hypothetical protein
VALPRAGVFAVMLLAVWLLVYPRTPDLAAAVYRANLFKHVGLALWDEHWYAGHQLVGYSVLFPPLAAALGLRALGCISVLVSVALFERLAGEAFGSAGRAGALLFAVAAVGDVWVGRVAFALGVALALLALFAFDRGHATAAGSLAVLCAAASPVAGALLALAGATRAVSNRSALPALSLAAPPALAVAALALLFGEGGFEPYPIRSFAASAVVIAAFVLALPRAQRALRVGALLYLAACVLALAVHTPMGSNVERYGVLLAGPLLLGALVPASALRSSRGRGSARALSRAIGARGALALLVWAVWCAWGPVRETAAVAGNPSTSAAYYAPVERFLAEYVHSPVRIEVPLTRSHWEAALLADSASLARGWEKQLDERYDGVLLASAPSAASYRRWLQHEAVSYVALPDAPLDPSSSAEGRLIRRGVPYLREVFASAHWRIYAVDAPTPILTGLGSLTSLGHDSFALRARAAGRLLVRVHYSRYLAVSAGTACVAPAREGWTAVRVRAPGDVVVKARFSLARALGLGGACG